MLFNLEIVAIATEDGPCLDAILGAKGRDRGLLLRFEALLFRRTPPLDCPPLCFHVPGRSRQPRKFRTRPADRAFHRAGLAGHVRVSTISDMRRCRRGFGLRGFADVVGGDSELPAFPALPGPLVGHIHDLTDLVKGFVGDLIGAGVASSEDVVEVTGIGDQLGSPTAEWT